jgi:predicted PurR-regulated permease PerM
MLALMGVPLSFLLGLITGLMAFVPYIGPITAAVPILLVSFIESPALALQVGVLFLAIQTIEDNVVVPLVFQRTVELPPALLITGQLALGAIFGILGIIFATPLTALAKVLVKELYVADTLDDPMDGTLGLLPELEGSIPPS